MKRSANSSVYDDKGSGHFGTYDILVEGQFDAESGADFKRGGIISLSNTSAATYNDLNTGSVGVGTYFRDASGSYQIRMHQFSDDNVDSYTISLSTLYYMTFIRGASTNTTEIYSNSDRSTLLDTLTVTYQSTTYKYIATCYSEDVTRTNSISFYTENIDLQEDVTFTPRVIIF